MKTNLQGKINWRLGIAILSVSTVLLVYGTQTALAANTTYYVNCAAGSNGSGTQASPWNNLATVSATTFGAGDKILFNRGTTCAGALWPKGSGASGNPVTLDAYGTGANPIINGGANQYAIKLSDQSYWQIQNIETTGGTRYGIYITSTTGVRTYFRLTNLIVHDVNNGTLDSKDTGLVVFSPTTDSSNSTNARFDNIVVDNVTAYNTNMWAGIIVGGGTNTNAWAPTQSKRSTNVTVRNSTVHDVYGDGIILFTVNNGLIENSLAYNTGIQPTQTIGTPNAIWTWACQTCTVQNNEAYLNHSPGVDGGAYDIDYFNNDNTVQYNYGHDNDTYCVSIFGAENYVTTNAIVRYNVCANNSRLAGNNVGDFFVYTWNGGSINGFKIYNNTSYWNPATISEMALRTTGAALSGTNFFKNNIIYSAGSVFTWVDANIALDYNIYWSTAAGTPYWSWGPNTWYTTLASYQAGSGQEAHSKYQNPLLNSPTYHGNGKPVSQFTLQGGSPAINAGTDVTGMGSRDFFGNTIPQGGAYDIGAHESAGGASPTSTPTRTRTPTITPTRTVTRTPTRTPTPTGANRLTNPGFESGAASPWGMQGTSVLASNPHGGTYAARTTGSSNGIWYAVSGLSPNTTYTFSAWLKAGAASNSAYLYAKNFGGTEVHSSTFSSTTYTQITIVFTTGAANTTAEVGMWRDAGFGTGDIYSDDFDLH